MKTSQRSERTPSTDSYTEWLTNFKAPETVIIDNQPYPYAAIAELTGMGQGSHEAYDILRIRLYGAQYARVALQVMEAGPYHDGSMPGLLDEAEALERLAQVKDMPAPEYDVQAIEEERARIAAAIAHNIPLAEYRTACIEQGLPVDDYGAYELPTAEDIAFDQSLLPPQPLSA